MFFFFFPFYSIQEYEALDPLLLQFSQVGRKNQSLGQYKNLMSRLIWVKLTLTILYWSSKTFNILTMHLENNFRLYRRKDKMSYREKVLVKMLWKCLKRWTKVYSSREHISWTGQTTTNLSPRKKFAQLILCEVTHFKEVGQIPKTLCSSDILFVYFCHQLYF